MLRRFGTHGIIGLGGISPIFNAGVSSIGPAYFVDDTGGNDANDGLSPSSAWQTIAKVNAFTFLPGDRVLFKRGETWTGTTLDITWSGSHGAPIIFGTYGAGASPIFDGNDVVNCVTVTNQSYLRFEDLECTQGFDFGFAFTTCHHITVTDCDGHDCGNDNLIFFTACYASSVSGGEFYNAYNRGGGILPSGIEIADGCYGIVIDGAICHDQIDVGAGITVHSHAPTIMPYNITVKNCNCYNNAGIGIRFSKADATVDTPRNIVIQANTTTGNTLDGIRVANTGAEFINGVQVLNNISRDNSAWGINLSGISILAAQNEVVSANAGGNTCVALSNCQSSQFYNNTLHGPTGAFFTLLNTGGASTASLEVKNNIVSGNGVAANPYMNSTAALTGVVGMDIDYNLYMYTGAGARWTWLGVNETYVNWLINSGQDVNSPARADPLFVNPAAGNFHLQAGSPARGVGVDVGYGTDLGAYQFV